MLVPSIDLRGGRVVQLVQGRREALAYDDVFEWVERFATFPRVQVIDLDAALGTGDNRALVAAHLPAAALPRRRRDAHARRRARGPWAPARGK